MNSLTDDCFHLKKSLQPQPIPSNRACPLPHRPTTNHNTASSPSFASSSSPPSALFSDHFTASSSGTRFTSPSPLSSNSIASPKPSKRPRLNLHSSPPNPQPSSVTSSDSSCSSSPISSPNPCSSAFKTCLSTSSFSFLLPFFDPFPHYIFSSPSHLLPYHRAPKPPHIAHHSFLPYLSVSASHNRLERTFASPYSSPVRMVKPPSPSDLATNRPRQDSLHITNPKAVLETSTLTLPQPLELPRNENDAQSVHSDQRAPSEEGSHVSSSKKIRVRRPPSAPLRIAIEPGHCLVFGRKPDLSLIPREVTSKSATIIPVRLPGTFTHASRTHCSCTLIAPPLGGLNIRIVVRGQNGLTVDGERFSQGSSAGVELERSDGEQIELGFWGGKRVECYVKLDDHGPQRVRPRAAAVHHDYTTNEPTESVRSGKRKGRPSHQTLTPLEYPLPSPRLAFSAANDTPRSAPSELPRSYNFPGPPPPKRQCLSAGPDASPYDPAILFLPPHERVRALIPSLGIDLVGLIASSIVFAPRATVSTTDVVRAVLEIQPSLAEAVLAVLPSPSSTRSSPRPSTGQSKSSRGRSTSAVTPQVVKLEHNDQLTLPKCAIDTPAQQMMDSKPDVVDLSPSGMETTPADEEPRDEKTERVVNACRPVVLENLQADWRADGSGMFGCVNNEGLKVRLHYPFLP